MSLFDLMLRTLLSYLQKLAEQSLSLWGVPEDARRRLINVAENTTYLVEASQGNKATLRVRGENYHTLRAIESELAWLETLGREKVIRTPGYCLGRNGRAIQFGNTDELNNARLRVLFHFVDGDAPDESVDMVHGFQELEASAARCAGVAPGPSAGPARPPPPAGSDPTKWRCTRARSASVACGGRRSSDQATSSVSPSRRARARCASRSRSSSSELLVLRPFLQVSLLL